MGNTESGPVVDGAGTSTATATATAAAYARASEEATAITKANIAEFYPRRKEVPHSSISIQRGSSANQLEIIEATLPQQMQQDHKNQLDETRDQHIQHTTYSNGERSKMRMNREEIAASPIQSRPAAQFIPPKSYKLTTGDTVHTIPVSKIELRKQCIFHPMSQRKQEEKKNDSTTLSQQDIEAKHLLQSIIHLDTEVTEATAAVYHYLETKKVEEEMSPSGRAREVMRRIKDELRKGNSKPAYQFLETARTVLPVLREEAGIDVEAGLHLEANIFSEDSEDSAKNIYDQHDDVHSISEQTAAIFQFLNDAKSLSKGDTQSVTRDPVGSKKSHVGIDPTTKGDSDANIFRILEENEELQLHDLAGSIGDTSDFEDLSNFNAPDVSDMDLEFVENFDLAYSEFLFYHPKLVAKNPDLMKNLRIYKLQKLLEYNEIIERNHTDKLDSMNEEKRVTEESIQLQLKDAVRKKAARQTFLESEVNDIHWNTKQLQAKLRWKVLKYSEDRAKRQLKLRDQFKIIPHANTRQELIPLIPQGPHSKKLETAIKASFIAEGVSLPDALSSRQEDQLRDTQVENSVVNSEIAMLNQKLARLRREANKLEWVQSTLVELDQTTMHKLKKQFEKKEGVVL